MLPNPVSISGVNKSTAKKIISVLLSSNGTTRTDLARACGVSAMTAGKVVRAMCDVGYASICEEFSACGRRADFIYPSDRFTFLVFDVGERAMSADIYDARESTIFSYTQPICDSIDRETDVKSFMALVKEHLGEDEERENYRLSALLYHGVNIDHGTLTASDISIALDKSDAAAEYVKSAYPDECAAFVEADSTCNINLIVNGKLIRGKANPRNRTTNSITSELDMLNALTSKLSGLFEFLIPDKLIIDSRSLHLSRRFASELYDRLTERTGLKKEELPELVTNDGIPFPSRAVVGQLIDIYADIISAK